MPAKRRFDLHGSGFNLSILNVFIYINKIRAGRTTLHQPGKTALSCYTMLTCLEETTIGRGTP
jgi:hypothetical protein